MDLQIEGRHVGVRPEWRSEIEARVNDLYPGRDITHVRVTLTKHDHRRPEDSYDVLVVVQIPGHTITARKQENSFDEAIRDAFAAMKTELDKIREKRGSHEVRMSAPPERGVVSRLFRDEGYGFIAMENGTEVYFHRNAVHDLTFEELEDGMEVSLNIEPGEKGPQATTVNPVPSVTEFYGNKGSTS
ncbi:MAG TPA: HPF/RaiA family ribosome-associated protein [Nitrospiraceae bacterium]|nr:HPF/RaiA family ribosome-associated protein [Nitrospiraceae bacterium]